MGTVIPLLSGDILGRSEKLFNVTSLELLDRLNPIFSIPSFDSPKFNRKRKTDLEKARSIWFDIVNIASDCKMCLEDTISAAFEIQDLPGEKRWYFFDLLRHSDENKLSLPEIVECSLIDIPGHKIIKKLGQSVFKKVYLGESKGSPGLLRAIKKVDPTQFGLELIKKHYGRVEKWLDIEMNITKLANIASQYVVRMETPILGQNGEYFLVETPFHETLRDKLNKEKKLSLEETLRIALQITKGLTDCYNYKKGPIIHKDLKPDNVGLDDEGNVKLTDFGNLGSMSTDHKEIANILYAAPETFEKQEITTKSNIWNIGVIIWEMMAGEPLFVVRDYEGNVMQKSSEYNEDRKKYIEKVKSQIYAFADIKTKFRYADLERTLSGFAKNEKEKSILRSLAAVLSGCLAYNESDRAYENMRELEEDIMNMHSYLRGRIDTLPPTLTDCKGEGLLVQFIMQNKEEAFDKIAKLQNKDPIARLAKYESVMESEDFTRLRRILFEYEALLKEDKS